MTDPSPWWRDAVVYQLYIRSFTDASGDGIGDIDGMRSRLEYLRDLGVDAVWVNPWFVSPMVDGGYDVADYRDIDPLFGTIADAQAFIDEAHALGLRVLLDIVPNHTSDQHPWFRAALAAGPGGRERDFYVFRDGRGRAGSRPPTDWPSVFGGPAWTRVIEPDGRPGQWYLHLFAPEQPDLDWTEPEVRAEFESILRFWFDRGADGFRIDVAHGLVKDPEFPDLGRRSPKSALKPGPYWDQDGVHDIYRRWRAIADEYGDRMFVAEVFVSSAERLARYLRPDELHTAFDFRFLQAGWDATALRKAIDASLGALAPVGAPATWVLSNHDQTRHVTRFGRAGGRSVDPVSGVGARTAPIPTDLGLGRRRARAALLLMLALPGCAYLYQGEELGLEEVEDLPDELLQDPTWLRTGHTIRGRDGCRVPLPWSGTEPPFGFGPPGSRPWLPQPSSWRDRTVERQTGAPTSFLELYRTALRLRREHLGFRGAGMAWLPAPDTMLRFDRPGGLETVVNLGSTSIELPTGRPILLASEPLAEETLLRPDTAVWLG
ncbi:MAG TPA: alpha-amylase family glycosyl hydrolase [Candidatus Limnocylindrales bacterium]|jgi:alpha-glucosidase|nr:alpha-amylase family glycosyl hydrolase [Candidatus Limnocylindrales bacterium]